MGPPWNRGEGKKKKLIISCVHQANPNHVPEEVGLPPEPNSSENHVLQPVEVSLIQDAKGRCHICRQEHIAARKYRWRVIIGLFFPFALQALDMTIIASALPWIASDFDKLSQMNWIISAFNLCSAAFIPFWGQLADIFGRTAAMEMALVVMIIGSALCTAAPLSAFPMLILGRALQGISEAGIIVISRTILADKVSLKENAKNSSVFAFFAGISYAVGPVIGGFLTSTSWRWCFGINLPVAVAGGLIVMVLLRPVLLGPQPLPENLQQTRGVKNSTIQRFIVRMSVIDYGGQFLFLFGMGLIILALTWGGASYGWGTVQVMLPLILGTILTGAFVSWEYWMAPGNYLAQRFPLQKPTIPWELLVQRNMALLFYINFATGMGMCFPHTALRYTANSALAMTAVLYFVDIYFTLVKAYTASQAGMQLLYYTPGIGIGVCMAMFMCNVWPKQTFAPLFLGSVIEATGISVLAWALNKSHIPTIYGMMGLTGAGTGLRLMPGSLHGIGFFPNDIASVIALTAFAVPFGGTLAMTIMDAVFNNKAGFGLDSAPPASSSGTSSSNFIQYISELPPDIEAMVRNSAKKGIIWSFIAILPFMWLCVVSASFLGNVRITKKRKTDEQGRTDFSENVTESSFLLSFFRRRPEDTSASLEAVVVEIPNREKVAVHV